jgi:cob(I)alamin adenosyltransferase
VGATFVSVLCRLDALIASVNAANDLGSAKTSLLNAVTKARGQAQAASTATKAKSQKAQLKKCAKSLQAFGHKLATKKAKKAIPQGTRDALAGEATAIRADVLALRGSL